MKKVLVTGGTGFIGRNVTQSLLEKGYTVYAPSITPIESCEGLIQPQIDLFNKNELEQFLRDEQFENMIHLAWYVGSKCHSSDVNIDWLNLSLELLKAFKKYGGKRVLTAGSVSEYDFSYGWLRENHTPLTNGSMYGKCKAALYSISCEYAKQNDLDFKWARIFNLYGPNEKPQRLMPAVINSMLAGEDVKVSDCSKIQDYLHVFDTAAAIVQFFESNVQGAVNICSSEPVRLRTIVEKIAQFTNYKGNILWGAIPVSFEDPFIVGDNTRLTKEVGWKQKYTMDEGLEQTVNWWKTHNMTNMGSLLNV